MNTKKMNAKTQRHDDMKKMNTKTQRHEETNDSFAAASWVYTKKLNTKAQRHEEDPKDSFAAAT